MDPVQARDFGFHPSLSEDIDDDYLQQIKQRKGAKKIKLAFL